MAREDELGMKILSLEVKGNLSGIRAVLREKGGSFPILLDSSFYAHEKLHISRTPTTFIIDRKGRIRCRIVGYVSDLEGLVEELLDRI